MDRIRRPQAQPSEHQVPRRQRQARPRAGPHARLK